MIYQCDKEAYCLAVAYGLLPPAAVYPARIRRTDPGKYEPYHYEDEKHVFMILAHYADKTNVLIKYNPLLNFFIPYHITGTLTPNAAGNYACESGYEDEFTYVLEGRTYFLWWDGVDSWIISTSVGWKEGPYWSRTDPLIYGAYDPYGEAVGIATVVIGPE